MCCAVLCSAVLSCPVLSCPVLSCLVLTFPVHRTLIPYHPSHSKPHFNRPRKKKKTKIKNEIVISHDWFSFTLIAKKEDPPPIFEKKVFMKLHGLYRKDIYLELLQN